MMDLQQCASREKIMALQSAALAQARAEGKEVTQATNDAVCPVRHHFAPGLYAREMFIPAGAWVIGKTHRFAHLNSVTKGRIAVASEHGTRIVCAGETFVSQPGIKRVGQALEDTIWLTYHPTQETDLLKIEAEVIEPEPELLPMTEQEALS